MSYQKTTLTRYGGWLPVSRHVHKHFVHKHVLKRAHEPLEADAPHHPAVAKFESVIKGSKEMAYLFDEIFVQVSPENKIPSFDAFLHMLDHIIVEPPKFHVATDDEGTAIGEPIGVPMYLIFDLLCNTDAACKLFSMPAFNVALKDLLDAWGHYLTTEDSAKTLTDEDEGWFSSFSMETLEANTRGSFNDTYHCPNPNAVNRGYASWDEFFTRPLKGPQVRPILAPEDNTLIHSACESTVYRIVRNVKAHDKFWIKGQPYSIYNMLNRDKELTAQFAGGTVYQAFLSPQDYHRWHAPVDGTIVKTAYVPGSYYAVLPDAGADVGDPDLKPGDPHGSIIRSQAWMTMHSARALIFIQADNPDIGLMCFIGVGMAEVSSCDIRVKEGQKVKIGAELGMFHFGGSSHALIFGPKVELTFADHVVVDQHLKVNSVIAQVHHSGGATKA
ncbi:phosphatidylserine decarboxylase [Moniliophthora roreri]|uniref:Putative phosphatidylserine decarboxylase n=1 Tax=Moniliophthora roreri TaxID=221103 RepID=A0A0W0G6H0_MONRR|nr:phosphatidylserine decarboxylase [Moniliophthora roreri]